MNFVHYDLGYKNGGEVVEVTLSGNAANVKLMTQSNFQNYRNGRAHQYIGGHYKQSPARLEIPSSGNWYVTVDLGGYVGNVNSSVRVLG